MRALLSSFYSECKYLIWPHLCACCKLFLRTQELLCKRCAYSVTPLVSVPLEVTARTSMQVYAVGAYQSTLKKLILAKSWHDERASVVLGALLWQQTVLPHIDFDVIVPIPLHWKRYAQRGYNQAEIMAQTLSSMSGKPMHAVLERKKATIFQSACSVAERKTNVQDAFALRLEYKELLRGKRVLLIDDLMTSGATLVAAARLIQRYKPESINGAVAGRVV